MSSVPRVCNQETERVDAIIVGLGPAGATALRLLGEAGLRVVGLDRADFPRTKACGGGLSSRATSFLPKGWDRIPHTVSTGVHLVYDIQPPVLFAMGIPIAYQFDRRDLDAFLVESAKSTGGEILLGTNVRLLEWKEGKFRQTCDPQRSYESRFLIAADGVTSSVLRFLVNTESDGLKEIARERKRPLWMYPASEMEIQSQTPPRTSDVLIDLSAVPGGYAWSFAKRDGKKNIGVVGFLKPLKRPLETLRSFLDTFPEKDGNRYEPAFGPATWLIPNYSRFKGHGKIPGLFLIGDAGAMVVPFLGEGIYYAMLSASRAVSEILQHTQSPEEASQSYSRWVYRSIFREFSYAQKLASVIYRFPGVYFRLVQKYPQVLSIYASVMTGKRDYRSFSRVIGKNLLKLPFRGVFKKLRPDKLI